MDFKKIIVTEKLKIRDALELLNTTAKKVLFVVDKDKLVGAISDGDIRRWILKNGGIDENVSNVMNPNPIKIYKKDNLLAGKLMEKHGILSVPVVNQDDEIVWIYYWNDIAETQVTQKIMLPVIIMAGGKGERLLPFTTIVPKPLIPIGEIPIVERVINSFRQYGCNDFTLTINYKKNMIKAYFEEIEKDYELTYVEENKPLGTGGSLYLLKNKINDTFIVSNCDILLEVDYAEVYDFHKKHNNLITVITSLRRYVVPYGVVDINDDGSINNMIEKPQLDYLVNTGVYFLEPEVLDYLVEDEFIHITDLVEICLKNNKRVGTYPISGDAWLDMGQFEDMEIMKERLKKV